MVAAAMNWAAGKEVLKEHKQVDGEEQHDEGEPSADVTPIRVVRYIGDEETAVEEELDDAAQLNNVVNNILMDADVAPIRDTTMEDVERDRDAAHTREMDEDAEGEEKEEVGAEEEATEGEGKEEAGGEEEEDVDGEEEDAGGEGKEEVEGEEETAEGEGKEDVGDEEDAADGGGEEEVEGEEHEDVADDEHEGPGEKDGEVEGVPEEEMEEDEEGVASDDEAGA